LTIRSSEELEHPNDAVKERLTMAKR